MKMLGLSKVYFHNSKIENVPRSHWLIVETYQPITVCNMIICVDWYTKKPHIHVQITHFHAVFFFK